MYLTNVQDVHGTHTAVGIEVHPVNIPNTAVIGKRDGEQKDGVDLTRR